MTARILAVATLIIVAAPAQAAEFFIVRGPDKKCKIVETRPVDQKIIVLGDKAFVTREEAEKQLKVVCKH